MPPPLRIWTWWRNTRSPSNETGRVPTSASAPQLAPLPFSATDSDTHGDETSPFAPSTPGDAPEMSASTTTTPQRQVPSTMTMSTSQRNISGPLPLDALSPSSENSLPPNWRPNPHTASQNKTSQYIDKIASENERLRRELHAARTLLDEQSKRVSAAKSKAEDSQAELESLHLLTTSNSRTIERKDRKIEELKAALEIERRRREVAEQERESSLQMLGELRVEMQKEVSGAREMQRRAEVDKDAAVQGFRRLKEGYEGRIRAIRRDVGEMREEGRRREDRIRRHFVVTQGIQGEVGRCVSAQAEMEGVIGKYKAEFQAEIERLVSEAEELRIALPSKEMEAEKLVEEMRETRDKMKWVMAQKERQRKK